MIKNYIIVGVDIGYGYIKAAAVVNDELRTVVFPTVIGDALDLTFETTDLKENGGGYETDKDNLRVKWNNKSYFIGELAIKQSDTPYRPLSHDREKISEIMLSTAISLLGIPQTGKSIRLVTGLPVKDYKLYKDAYLKTFSGRKEIEVTNTRQIFNIEKVLVVPQPYGTYCDGLFQNDLTINQDYANSMVGIIDIGHNTSDIIQMHGEDYIEKYSFTSPHGISEVNTKIAKYLNNNYAMSKEEYEVTDLVRDKELVTRSGKIDLSKIIQHSYEVLETKLSNEIKSEWKNIQELAYIIVTGGGGKAIINNLKDSLGKDIILSPESQYANVKGYLLWGEYMWGDLSNV